MHFGHRCLARCHCAAHSLDLFGAFDHSGQFSDLLAAADIYIQGIESTDSRDFDAVNRKATIGSGMLAQEIINLGSEMSSVFICALTGFEIKERRTAA